MGGGLCIIAVCLIIGLPCMLMGCNSTISVKVESRCLFDSKRRNGSVDHGSDFSVPRVSARKWESVSVPGYALPTTTPTTPQPSPTVTDWMSVQSYSPAPGCTDDGSNNSSTALSQMES
eukprot:gene42277-52418_t